MKGKGHELRLVVAPSLIPLFYPMLQQGFQVRVCTGRSIRDVLCAQLHVSADYVAERISTIFLDGKPVDDMDSAIVRENCTLALSSAMPGLVGATMRRRGFYASFRSAITYEEGGKECVEEESLIRVKLFNLVMTDLGPLFLERGIYMSQEELHGFITSGAERLLKGCKGVILDGHPSSIAALSNIGGLEGGEWVELKISVSE